MAKRKIRSFLSSVIILLFVVIFIQENLFAENTDINNSSATVKKESNNTLADNKAPKTIPSTVIQTETPAGINASPVNKVDTAKSEVDKKIANELSDIYRIRAEQKKYGDNLKKERESLLAGIQGQNDYAESLNHNIDKLPPSSNEADVLYDMVVKELQNARGNIKNNIAAYRSTPHAPRYAESFRSVIPIDSTQASMLNELEGLSAELNKSANELNIKTKELEWLKLKSSVVWTDRLNNIRLGLLDKMTPQKRKETLGLNKQGIEQLNREIYQLFLFAEWVRLGEKRVALEKISKLKDPYTASAVVTKAVWVIFLIIVYIFVKRRGRHFIDRLQSLLLSSLKEPFLIMLLRYVFLIIYLLFDEIILLTAVILSPYVIVFRTNDGVWGILYFIALWYAGYRFVIKAANDGISYLISNNSGNISKEKSTLLLRSIHLCGRFALTIAIVMILSGAVLGKGYLYDKVFQIALVGGILIFAILIKWWRQEISNAYLKLSPAGGLANIVKQTNKSWYGFFVAIAAFCVLFINTLFKLIQKFISSFEQTQRMLAYIFKKRLERNIKDKEPGTEISQTLPEEKLLPFYESPSDDLRLKIDYFTQMDAFLKTFEKWRSGKRVGPVNIVGNMGYGKTTWLKEALYQSNFKDSIYINLDERVISEKEVLNHLASGLGAPPEAGSSIDELYAWILSGERRLIILDNLHFWFMRGVNTINGLKAFSTLAEKTSGHVFWLCSFSLYPYQFYSWIMRGDTVFSKTITLPPWPDEMIGRLINLRSQLTGLRFNYENLLSEQLPGFAGEAQLLDTSKDYNRYIWDATLGSPRAALHYWVKSISAEDEYSVHVRFYKGPGNSVIEKITETDKLVLSSIVWHEEISIKDVCVSLNCPEQVCRESVTRLKEVGMIIERDSYFRVSIEWWPEIIRYLKRKHMIPSTGK